VHKGPFLNIWRAGEKPQRYEKTIVNEYDACPSRHPTIYNKKPNGAGDRDKPRHRRQDRRLSERDAVSSRNLSSSRDGVCSLSMERRQVTWPVKQSPNPSG
jgi:hypothetical protein